MIVRINEATRSCLGGDNYLDWDDFSKFNSGSDSNGNGISNSMEQKEMCFYKEMGWFDGQDMVKSKILADFDSWNDKSIQASFNSGVNECASWGGSFSGSRKKRSIEEEDSFENLSMLSHIRNKRQAPQAGRKVPPGKKGLVKKAPAKNGPGKKGPIGPGARKNAGLSAGKLGGKKPAIKGSIRQAGKGPKKAIPKKTGPNIGQGQGQRQNEKDDSAYNKLWCIDLVVQFGLKECVEDILDDL